MSNLIIYGSHYGTAKSYATQFSKLIHIPMLNYKAVKGSLAYDTIIHFGSLYAGQVKGLKKTLKYLSPTTKLIIVTVGLADVTDKQNKEAIKKAIAKQVPTDILKRTSIVNLRGGINYQKLTFLHRFIMSLMYHKCKKIPKEKQTADIRGIIETYNQTISFIDYADLNQIHKFL